ncbi:MAG: hypothetical protein P0116_09580 [Candidatus Nitrosocosmicus sp.]|nr:hypothetical protein [Candidatus Nitrosocosmicus sp.]
MNAFNDNGINISTTAVIADTDPVPTEKIFVVEHISGVFVVGQNDIPDAIWAYDDTNRQNIYLPIHFASRPLNFGGTFGVGKYHQFGSPVTMYVQSPLKLHIRGDANSAGRISAYFVGRLESTT